MKARTSGRISPRDLALAGISAAGLAAVRRDLLHTPIHPLLATLRRVLDDETRAHASP
jgi:hypothetical protein